MQLRSMKQKRKRNPEDENGRLSKINKVLTEEEGTCTWSPELILSQLTHDLSKKGNATDSVAMKRYMRDRYEFYGVKSPTRREISKVVFDRHNTTYLQRHHVKQLVTLLWSQPRRELQYVAMDFLVKHRKLFCESQVHFEDSIAFLKFLVIEKAWWDTVDILACKVVGYLVCLHPTQGVAAMQDWVASDNMWLRRSAIIHQLGCKENTNVDMLFDFCKRRSHETEFFIQKAIGWALRDYARTGPDEVKMFLYQNKSILSKLSYKEAAKHLST